MERYSTMLSSRMRVTGVLAALTFLTIIMSARADRWVPTIEIWPPGLVQKITVEQSTVIICRLDVPHSYLINYMKWVDPMNRTIETYMNASFNENEFMKYDMEMFTVNKRFPGIRSLSLYIPAVRESMAGTYYCMASYAHTELLIANVTIEPIIAIKFNNAPENQYPMIGENFKVMCEVTARPPPTVYWLRNDVEITSGDRYVVETNGLLIKNVRESDNGKYACRAKSTREQMERLINIEVLVPPRISELYNITAPVKGRTYLSCKATGHPAPTIQFKKWGTDEIIASGLQNEGRLVLESNLDRELGESIGTLYFEDIERSDDGLYECIATNAAGMAYKNGHLTVEFPPMFNVTVPQSPVWSWNRRPTNLTCLVESIPNSTIEWRFYNLPLQESRDIKIYNVGTLSYVTIVPTEQWMYDRYRCIATNVLGQDSLDIELREARVPGPVLQSKLESITATSIRVSIVGPAENGGPPVIAFNVQYKEDRNFDFKLGKNKTWSVNSPYVIEDLMPLTMYNFRFAAVNQIGSGPFGVPQMYITPRRSAPAPPQILNDSDSLTLLSAYADQYEVRWKIPLHNGEPIDMYDIKYCPVRKVNGEWQLTSDNECVTQEIRSFETLSYQMRLLKPDTYYKISIRAHNILGFSTPSEIYVRTVKGSDIYIETAVEPGFYNYTPTSLTLVSAASDKHAQGLGFSVFLSVLLYILY